MANELNTNLNIQVPNFQEIFLLPKQQAFWNGKYSTTKK